MGNSVTRSIRATLARTLLSMLEVWSMVQHESRTQSQSPQDMATTLCAPPVCANNEWTVDGGKQKYYTAAALLGRWWRTAALIVGNRLNRFASSPPASCFLSCTSTECVAFYKLLHTVQSLPSRIGCRPHINVAESTCPFLQ